jgi:hypothetical protein
VNRLTKHIHLALVSSSLAVLGCQRNEPTCEPQSSKQNDWSQGAGTPSACGPVDGRYHGSGGYVHHYGGRSYGAGRSYGTGVHSSVGGGSRGGFGHSAHGGGS